MGSLETRQLSKDLCGEAEEVLRELGSGYDCLAGVRYIQRKTIRALTILLQLNPNWGHRLAATWQCANLAGENSVQVTASQMFYPGTDEGKIHTLVDELKDMIWLEYDRLADSRKASSPCSARLTRSSSGGRKTSGDGSFGGLRCPSQSRFEWH
jgi:hypothetical protein